MNGELIEALQSQGSTFSVARSTLSALRKTSNALEMDQIALRSYGHPNGFRKWIIANANGYVLRLHVWPAGMRDSDAHSHRWDFRSFILRGSLHQEFYQEVSSDSAVRLTKCQAISPEDGSGEYIHTEIEKICLLPIHQSASSAGSAYWMDYRTIHRAWVPSRAPDSAVTLMLTSPLSRPHSYVYTERAVRDSETVRVESLTADQLYDDLLLVDL